MEPQVAANKRNPYFDEDAFQQLLAAAYVIQQQNDLEKEAPHRNSPLAQPSPDPDETLAIIADTQEMLRSLPYDRTAAANLIAERLLKITQANGIAIAVERDGQLEYCAALGTSAAMAGSSIAITSNPSPAENPSESDQDDQASDSPSASHIDGNTIALPLTCQGKISGILEVRFNQPDSIHENEMTACQLMAGLMTEALGRAADLEWKRALAAERATMLEALGRIMPQLERLASEAAPPEAGSPRPPGRAALDEPLDLTATLRSLNLGTPPEELENTPPIREARDCTSCGNNLGMGERFCGKCGTPSPEILDFHEKLSNNSALEENYQPTLATLDGESKLLENRVSSEFPGMSDDLPSQESAQVAPQVDHSSVPICRNEPLSPRPIMEEKFVDKIDVGRSDALAVRAHPHSASLWNSSLRTRRWLESLKADSPGGIWLARQRANVYVAVAVTLLVVAIMGWGMRSPEVLQAQSKNPAQPPLTLFEELLVKLDLAEVAPPPTSAGNPNTQVWVDLHHALYYCPGSDLYGKTAGGKFTTQRDAQVDQFEPAERKNCN